MNSLVIAIDGPAASGKGTISKAISEKLKFHYLDTGKLYRAIGAKYLEGNEPISAAKNLNEAQKGIIFAAFLKLLMPAVVVLPGLAAAVLKPNIENSASGIWFESINNGTD